MSIISKRKRENCNVINEFAAQIIDIFEEKLEELDITLPDKERTGSEDESRIFGSNYYELESKIAEFISMNKRILNKRSGKNARIFN